MAYENKNNDLMPSPGKQCQYRGSSIIGTLITVLGLLGFQFSDFDYYGTFFGSSHPDNQGPPVHFRPKIAISFSFFSLPTLCRIALLCELLHSR